MTFQRGSITEYLLKSEELSENIQVLVYTPPTFSTSSKYEVIITQDVKDYFQLGKLSRFADELIGKKDIENILIVGTHYKSIEDRRNKYHPNGSQNQDFIRFLTNELVPWIDRNYPTYEDRHTRAIMGDSLAGTVSLLCALQNPHIFGKVIVHSPYVDEQVLDIIDKQLVPINLDIYHVIGKEETVVKVSNNRDFLTPNRKLKEILDQKGFHYFYDEFDGGHSWKFWQPDVRRALITMFSKNH